MNIGLERVGPAVRSRERVEKSIYCLTLYMQMQYFVESWPGHIRVGAKPLKWE